MKRSFRKNTAGFTLVEIMIVVVIIVVLAYIGIPNLLRATITANETSAQTTLKTIATALENYSVIHAVYPADTDVLIGDAPPYLNKDFFNGNHSGYTYTATLLSDYAYTITAAPISASAGTHTYVVTTGALLREL